MDFDDMYTDGFIDQYQHIFMSLEQGVMDHRVDEPDLTDRHVDKVYEGLERTYKKQSQGRKAPTLRFKPPE
ncbi:MAG: hypothetical protein ACPG7F_06835 [Aggregatilineales bacterium]